MRHRSASDPRLGLLRRHFLRRFLEPDALSSRGDRLETLALAAAILVAPPFFLSWLFGTKYLVAVSQDTPGIVALAALDDKLWLVGLSMVALATTTVLSWDALTIDARDRAFLGPLPLDEHTLVKAKLQAAVGFIAAVLLAVNLVPSLFYSILHVANLGLPLSSVVRLWAAHLCAVLLAGTWATVAVLVLRGVAVVLSRTTRLQLAGLVQAVLVAALLCGVLLMPSVALNAGTRWLSAPTAATLWMPPLWFLGVYELVGNEAELSAPAPRVPARLVRANRRDTERYRSLRPLLEALAARAVEMMVLACTLAVVVIWLEVRVLADRVVSTSSVTALGRRFDAVTCSMLRLTPTARAAFCLVRHTFVRSGPHRLALVVALAAALATSVVLLSGISWEPIRAGAGELSTRLLAVQTAAIALLVLGVRQAIRLPADSRATGMVRAAWYERPRCFLTGVRLATAVTVILPLVALLGPIHLWALGAPRTLAHAAFGCLVGATYYELLSWTLRGLPLLAAYVPSDRLKGLAPLYGTALIVGVAVVASVERWALSSASSTTVLLAAATGLWALVSVVGSRRRLPPTEWAGGAEGVPVPAGLGLLD